MNLNLRLFLFCLFTSLPFVADAQVIKGVVQDAVTRAPLPFANVFLNNTTKGTVTDEKGEFLLKVLHEPGNYELVVSYVGYESYKAKVSLSENEILSATVILAPSEQELKDVEVRAAHDKVWEKQLKRFKKVFLGDDLLADSCKILNPWVIDFVQEKGGKMLAYAREPIEIDNDGMGYKLIFYLKYFWTDRTGYFIGGNVQFAEKQSSDEREVLQWQMNRKISYLRSRHHLFKAIVDQRIKGEGFRLYSEKNSIVAADVRSPIFSEDLGKLIFPHDTTDIVKPGRPGTYVINMKGRIEIHFENHRAAVRTYRDVPYAVSWIRLSSNRVVVGKDGYEINPADVTVSGDMSASRVSRMLPLDYKPTDVIPLKDSDGELLQPFREKIYVQTNKPYYYSGEPLWFKGYIAYTNPSLRDSLSRTVYVELINPGKEIVLSKTLEILDGTFSNDFVLPGSLSKGTYYLRAYTNFNRNFGDSSLFVKPVPILGDAEKAAPVQVVYQVNEDSLFVVTADKEIYKPREKITLTITTQGDDGLPVAANASLAVTDDQVVPIEEPVSLLNDFLITEKDKRTNLELTYPIEHGFSFSGRFLNNNGKPEMTIISGIQVNSGNLLFTQSDEKGLFAVRGLHHYDTTVFMLKSEKAVDKPYGRIELIRREPAAIHFSEATIDVPLLPGKSQKRAVTEYEVPKDAYLLKEVMVKARPISQDDEDDKLRRPYGKPDYVLKGKDINASYGNLLQTLPGKVPGLVVRQVLNQGEGPRWMVYIQRQASINHPAEVVVTINDVFTSGSPAQIISSIDPNIIETIEVKIGINVLYGNVGGYGILSIYTKNGLSDEKTIKDPNFQRLKVAGYASARNFRHPDYNDPTLDKSQSDHRSTIYWNPNVIIDPQTGTATVSFFAADLEGKYRIVAEGVTQNGEPIRWEGSVKIKE